MRFKIQEVFVLVAVITAFLVIADTVGNNVSTLNFNEDSSSVYNFSVNSTGTLIEQNVTWLNITFHSSFSFAANTNFSTAGTHSFSNTSTVLSWFSAAGLVMNTTNHFSFNLTASNPGTYNITVQSSNTTGETNYTNFTITINDTSAPSNVSFVSPTAADATNSTTTEIIVNVSVTDNLAVNVIRIYLFNSSFGIVNQSNTTTNAAFFNYSGLANGVYYLNATANDTTGNQNLSGTGTRTYRIDNTAPSNVSFVSPTANTGTNSSTTEIRINVSITDATMGAGTARIYLFNASHGLRNNTNVSGTHFYINYSGLTEGHYYINATANDSIGNQNLTGTGTRTLIIDTSAPFAFDFAPSSFDNVANRSANEFLGNVTINDSLTSVTARFYVYNSSSLYNQTNVSGANSSYISFNFTGLPDGLYMLNVTSADSASNANSTTRSRFVRIDTVLPVVNLSRNSNSSQNKIVLDINITEAGSGIIGVCASSRVGAVVTGSGTNTQTLVEDNLACSNSYSYIIRCTDFSGNNGSVTQSFTTNACSGGSSSGGGGGGSVQLSPETTWKSTFTVSSEQFINGHSVALAASEQFKVSISSETHYIGVLSVSSDGSSVEIEVRSTPQRTTMTVGETKKFDTSSDGYYDTQVTLNSISNGKANITVKSIYEAVPPAQEEAADSGVEGAEVEEGVSGTEGKNSSTWWIVGIIVILVAIYLLIRRKQRKHHKKKI